MPVPQWATELVDQVCSDYKRTVPRVNWRQSQDRYYHNEAFDYKGERIVPHRNARVRSSGVTYTGKNRGQRLLMRKGNRWVRDMGHIAITAGSDIEDQRLVLLHELAHWVVGRVKSHHHDRKFWDMAFELYDRYGVNESYARDRESEYKKGAIAAYDRRTK